MLNIRRLISLKIMISTLAVLLSGCGGGGGGGATPPPANSNPSFTSTSTKGVPENDMVAYSATASDPNAGDSLSYSITGGDDSALFSISASSGELSFVAAPDFENPQDTGADNVYDVTLSVSDGRGGSASLAVAVTVTDVTMLEFETTFPSDNAEFGGDATEITVSGKITDLEDGETLATDVQFIDVNGVAGVQTAGDLDRWSALIPVSGPGAQIDVSLRPTTGADLAGSVAVTNQSAIQDANNVVVDAANNRAIIYTFFGTLVAVDLTTGLRTELSGDNVGAGPALESVSKMAIDSANGMLYAEAGGVATILEVDLSNGDRRVLSDLLTGTGLWFGAIADLAVDAANNRLLVTDSQTNAVVGVDLATGNRAAVSDATTGLGLVFVGPTAIVVDAANGRALVLDSNTLHAVDLLNGNRTVLSVNVVNTGPAINNPSDMLLESANNRVLVPENSLSAVIAIDLSSGDRTVAADAATGSGADFDEPFAIATDTVADSYLVLDSALQSLFRVSSITGDRTIQTSNEVGAGPAGIDYSYTSQSSVAVYSALSRPGAGGILFKIDKANGERTIVSSDDVGTGSSLMPGFALEVNETTNTALWSGFVGNLQFHIVSIDLATGNRTTICSDILGLGPLLLSISAIGIDAAANRAIVLDGIINGVVEVDLATGDRTVLSNAIVGSGPIFVDPRDMAIESGNNSVLVTDGTSSRVFRVDLTTGDRTIVADNATGSGPVVLAVRGVDIDQVEGIAYLVGDVAGSAAVVSMDLVSLARTEVSGENVGRGAELTLTGGLVFDGDKDRLIVTTGSISALSAIDIATGDRAILSR